MTLWSKQYLFSIVLLCFCVTTPANILPRLQASCHDHERSALLQFKHSFILDCAASDPTYAPVSPKMKSWGGESNEDCCLWDGVECDEEMGYVIGLYLTNSCLVGSIPPNSSLFSLTHLKKLYLSYNNFNNSPIPSEIGKLSKLRELSLKKSQFSGQIPSEISRLSQLSVLSLRFNRFELHEPSLEGLVRNLTRLEELYLGFVDISSPVPNILSNITSLKTLSLPKCDLQGQLPQSIFHLPLLELLDFSFNIDLAGFLPEFHHNSPLNVLTLYNTAMSGEIPPSIGKLAHLETLDVDHSHFSGKIPFSLGNLTNLTTLELDGNNFSGGIPSSLANLTQLTDFVISDLNAEPDKLFSWLSKLHKLTNLGLFFMNLSGEIPSILANFTGLEELYLDNNQLTGQIPDWLMNMTQLEILSLSDNQLKGPIPQTISQLANLQYLDLSGNYNLDGAFDVFLKLEHLFALHLSGIKLTFSAKNAANESVLKLQDLRLSSCNLTEFPQILYLQDELQILELSNNKIHGLIPQWFMNVSTESLYTLDLSHNLFTGFEQPVLDLPWRNLASLSLNGNRLQGLLPIPSNSMVFYQASGNSFTGHIPQEICQAGSLRYFDISDNDLGGEIPECISELGGSLVVMNLKGNNFHGAIPRQYPKSCKLKMINLSQNQLEGNMPRSLANCIMLQVLDIGNNHVNDTFPSWLGNLPNLQILILRHNRFHGGLNRQNVSADFKTLRIIDLSHNFYSGDLLSHYLQKWDAMKVIDEDQSIPYSTTVYLDPLFKGNYYTNLPDNPYNYSITITNKGQDMPYPKILTVLRVIDFSSNNFTGKIPDSIGECRGLQALNLSNNNLEGSIPSSLSNMKNIESLDLSMNMLSGKIPQELSQLQYLEVFNVSHNRLMGPIPQGKQFNTFDNSSYEGNLGLCGSPLSQNCGNADEPPTSPSVTESEEDDDSKWVDWIVRSCGCVGGFIVGFVIGKIFITDRYHDWFMETFNIRKSKKRMKRAPRRRN